MLKVQSFKFNESDKINELLQTKRLASGAHILVSNGDVIIPFEDGEPPTKEQRVIGLKEQKNTLLGQMDIIKQSNAVVLLMRERAEKALRTEQADLDEATAELTREKGEKYKDADDKYLRSSAENFPKLKACILRADTCKRIVENRKAAIQEDTMLYEKNERELYRLQMNVDVIDEDIEEITNGNG